MSTRDLDDAASRLSHAAAAFAADPNDVELASALAKATTDVANARAAAADNDSADGGPPKPRRSGRAQVMAAKANTPALPARTAVSPTASGGSGIPASFPVRVQMTATTRAIMSCTPKTLCREFLKSSLLKMKKLGEPMNPSDVYTIADGNGLDIALEMPITQSPYVLDCIAQKKMPVLTLVNQSRTAAPPAAAATASASAAEAGPSSQAASEAGDEAPPPPKPSNGLKPSRPKSNKKPRLLPMPPDVGAAISAASDDGDTVTVDPVAAASSPLATGSSPTAATRTGRTMTTASPRAESPSARRPGSSATQPTSPISFPAPAGSGFIGEVPKDLPESDYMAMAREFVRALPPADLRRRRQLVASTQPGRSRSSSDDRIKIECLFDTGKRVTYQAEPAATVATIKGELFDYHAPLELEDRVDEYTLLGDGPDGYVQDESMVLGCLPFVVRCRAQSLPLRFFIAEKSLIRRDKEITRQIGALIGKPVFFGGGGADEVHKFRNAIKTVRDAVASQGDALVQKIEPLIFLSDVRPPNVPATHACRFHLEDNTIEKTVSIDLDARPQEVVNQVMQRLANTNVLTRDVSPDECLLKVSGQLDYLIGEYPLWKYDYIRATTTRGVVPDLTIIVESEVEELNENDEVEYIPEMIFEEDIPDDAQGLYHEDMTIARHHPGLRTKTSLRDIERNFRVFVMGVENMSHFVSMAITEGAISRVESFYGEVGLYHGQERFGAPVYTSHYPALLGDSPMFNEWAQISFSTRDIPKAARLCFTIWGQKKASTDIFNEDNNIPLGCMTVQLINYRDQYMSGRQRFRLWPLEEANPLGTTVSNPSQHAPTLWLYFDEYSSPVVFPLPRPLVPVDDSEILDLPADPEVRHRLERIIAKDPLATISPEEKRLIWDHRYHLVRIAEALPKLCLSTNWGKPDHVTEVHRLLRVWEPLDPVDALELLDANFIDAEVRSFAVRSLSPISDPALNNFLLQLVQAIKYEPYHFSDLATFLLERALRSRKIGHSFFWFLKAEVEEPATEQRYSLLVEAYLRGCGAHRHQLSIQNEVLQKLTQVANAIKMVKDKEERKETLRMLLSNMTLPPKFQILLKPTWEGCGLKVEKCKYMDSKKLPLWLVFENSDSVGKDHYIMFKAGDDLRQDMLTLQMFGIMDQMWEEAGIDMRLQPYGCISTGFEVGMLEIVKNSDTIANIQMSYGGTTAAFKEEPLAEWLRHYNPSAAAFRKAQVLFAKSCAAYCVATYVLGIGDRHNDNIMLQQSGRFFHIDFGHFLGNIKRKLGVKRERTPFVLTPDMLYVMDGKHSELFQEFRDYCLQCYAIVRRKASLFMILFGMMVSTGIPELRSTSDLEYLRTALAVGMTEDQAADFFLQRLDETIEKAFSTQLNFLVHNIAHRK